MFTTNCKSITFDEAAKRREYMRYNMVLQRFLFIHNRPMNAQRH